MRTATVSTISLRSEKFSRANQFAMDENRTASELIKPPFMRKNGRIEKRPQ
jgi:hypothetical protein